MGSDPPGSPACADAVRIARPGFVPPASAGPLLWPRGARPVPGAEATKSPAAARLWAKADREFTDQAPVVPFVTPSQIDFVSRRVGNYQYGACVGALLDQLWVN